MDLFNQSCSVHDFLTLLFDHKTSLHSLYELSSFKTFIEDQSLKISPRELIECFTHKSFSHEYKIPDQERLEFLGDAVVELILTEEIMKMFPHLQEGQLSKLRASLVNEESLSFLARKLNLDQLILVGKGEFKRKLFLQNVVLADSFEALIAQVYRNHGLDFTKYLLMNWITNYLPEIFEKNWEEKLSQFDVKSTLQEKVLAKFKTLPKYMAEETVEGFKVSLYVENQLILSGFYPSKKNRGEGFGPQSFRKKSFLK